MSDFDPNDELGTQEQADRYVNWCAGNFMRLSAAPPRTYRTAWRSASWLFVVASAQLHLDEEVTERREELLQSLSMYQALGRAIERQVTRIPTERLIVLRGSIDCWEPVGRFAGSLLHAVKCAVAARLLIDLYPLADLWELEAPDAWALLDAGRHALAGLGEHADSIEFRDYAVRPDERAVGKYTWQRSRGIVRRAGIEVDLSEN